MTKRKFKLIKNILQIVFNVMVFVFVLINICVPICLQNADAINQFLGIRTDNTGNENGGEYYTTEYNSMQEVHDAFLDVIEETMEEGAVLLKNKDNTLPLKKNDKVTLYGAASHHSIITGQGSSGRVPSDDKVTLREGLTKAGLVVNATLDNWYKDQGTTSLGGTVDNNYTFTGGKGQNGSFIVKDIAWDALPNDKNSIADAAIMVVARASGESHDLYYDITLENGVRVKSSANGDALTLTQNEKSLLTNLQRLKEENVIGKIIVIMNTAVPMQCEFIHNSDYGIDACIWSGYFGDTGANALGNLLVGEKNFSGKLVDTAWTDHKYNPVYYNYNSTRYVNSDILEKYTSNEAKSYIVYQEGIYNGYKYTETRYEDIVTSASNVGTFDYSQVVSYPFGFGLSYTNFSYSNMKVVENENDTYTVTVDVTNNTAVDGKEAVQLYLQKPYTAKDKENGVEKAAVELVGFDKVTVPGNQTVTATIEVEEKYFAAYDSEGEKTYVIGSSNPKDKYLLTAARNAHEAVNNVLRYKKDNGVSVAESKITYGENISSGDASLVWGKYFEYDAVKYSTNEHIKNENESFVAQYEGQEANYGVNKITNQFEDVDFKKVDLFSAAEKEQVYLSRSNWKDTFGKTITLTATNKLKTAQAYAPEQKDYIDYPTFGDIEIVENGNDFEELKLIHLRGKEYNDPLWDSLLDCIEWEEMCELLLSAGHFTASIDSISAPSSYQLNGSCGVKQGQDNGCVTYGFKGFALSLDSENASMDPPCFGGNSTLAATYNADIMERTGKVNGDYCAWIGSDGLYGFGGNMHRSAYGGRAFEYYSEDAILSGITLGHEIVGIQKTGVYAVVKHAILNEAELNRHGVNTWAPEQSIREIYSRVFEIAIDMANKDSNALGVNCMSGFNRLGAKWTGAQGFLNKVFRAEYGMRGFVVSDYYNRYMSPIQGVQNGNDIPDGDAMSKGNGTDFDNNSINFRHYSEGYGKLAWSMRIATKNVLFTIVNSISMNGITSDMQIGSVTPVWEKVFPICLRVTNTIFVWSAILYIVFVSIDSAMEFKKSLETL